MDLNKSVQNFFTELLADTEKQFKQSPIYQKQCKLGERWNYSVCATPILKRSPVIFGINWGGKGKYPAQAKMPSGNDITNYYFIKRSREKLEKQLGLDFSAIDFNYANLCFFRTPKEKELEIEDYKLSIPLFEKYVRYINPNWILSIGNTNIKILERFGLLKNIKQYFDKKGKFKGYSAKLWDWNIYSVPHPSGRLPNDSRNTIWSIVTTEINRESTYHHVTTP